MRKGYVVTFGYNSYAFDKMKDAVGFMETAETATQVNIDYHNGQIATIDPRQNTQITLAPLEMITGEELESRRAKENEEVTA